MKVIHVVPSISEEASGPSYSVPRLCEALINHGERVTLAALAWSAQDRNLPYLRTFPIDAGWPLRLGSSRAMHRWLADVATSGEAVIFHNHGMWQMNSLYPAWAARRTGGRCKLVVSPRGALSEWSMQHGSSAKRLFWPLLQHRALRAADCFHASAESEYKDIRNLGFKQPVAIIPNGIDVPTFGAASPANGTFKTLLFLGRVHKKKGLDLLLPAWASLQRRHPDWRLRIVGSDEGYRVTTGYLEKIRQLADHLAAERAEFAGELTGEEKWHAYRDANLFILPTYSENFGIAVAESLACGTPAIVTRGAPWGGLETEHAGWWVEPSVGGLAAALGDAMSRPAAELAEMGKRGQEWMRREFAWNRIGEKMSLTYQWLTGALGQRPSWVMID